MEDYIVIGKTRKVFGLDGELRFRIKDAYLDDFDQADVVYLKVMGKPLPYFIESVRVLNTPLIKFEDVNSPEEAKLITSCEILMKASDLALHQEEEPETQYGWLTGYRIEGKEKGAIGEIREVVEYPQQELAVVKIGKRDVLIPLNEEFISSVDEQNRIVYMQLPEGLLDT